VIYLVYSSSSGDRSLTAQAVTLLKELTVLAVTKRSRPVMHKP